MLELMGLAVDRMFKIFLRALDPPHFPEVVMGVDRLRLRSSAEELGNLSISLLISLLCKGKVLPVRLGLP